MNKSYWRVGFSYYPHESLATEVYYCYGTEQQAKDFCIDKVKNHPLSYVRNDVSICFDATVRTKVFIEPLNIVIL